MIILTDIVLFPYPSFGTQTYSLNDGRIYINISSNADGSSNVDDIAHEANFGKWRFGPLMLTQVSTGLGWAVDRVFEVPLNASRLSMAVSVDHPELGKGEIGRIELNENHMQDVSLHENNRLFEAAARNGTNLCISSACIYIPHDEEGFSNSAYGEWFHETSDKIVQLIEHKEYQRLLEGYKNGFDRSGNIGDHFFRYFLRSGLQMDVNKAISYYEQAVHLMPNNNANNHRYLKNLGHCFDHRFQHWGDLADIEEAISHFGHALHLIPDGHADKLGHLTNLGDSFLRRFGRSRDLTDLDKAIYHYGHALFLTPDTHGDKTVHLTNLGSSFARRFQHSENLRDIDRAITHHRRAVYLTLDGDTDKPIHLSNVGTSFARRFQHSGKCVDIDQAISYHELAVNLSQDGDVDKAGHISNVGTAYFRRFELSGDRADIDRAVSHHKNSVRLTPDGHASKALYLSNLGNSYLKCYESSGDLVDIKQAISCHEHAVHLVPDGHANKPVRLSDLGNVFLKCFERLGNLTDIDKAISHYELAVRLTPHTHADRPSRLSDLGNSYFIRFECSGDLVDIGKAISHHEHSARLTSNNLAEKSVRLNNLGNAFLRRFELSGDLTDIDEAICHLDNAVRITPEGCTTEPDHLSDLGNPFLKRFEQLGKLIDLDKAVAHYEVAVCLTPDGHASRPHCLSNLGNSFIARFERSGDLLDINTAITHNAHAVQLTPDSHGNKSSYLTSLGNSFLRRFAYSGDLVDVDKAIYHYESAVRLTLASRTGYKPGYLSNLGNAYFSRFQHSEDLEDIKKAISHHEHAIRLTPVAHANVAKRLSSLGISFAQRFKYSGNLADIDRAIAEHERAVHLTSKGYVERSQHLSNLGNSLALRFQHSGDLMDIDKAVSYHEHAVDVTPDGHAVKLIWLNNLGNSLLRHFARSKDVVDVDKAISYHQLAVNLTPDGHADKPDRLRNLGTSFLHRFKHTGDDADLQSAISSFQECATSSSGKPLTRFKAALEWADLSSITSLSTSLSGYETAMLLLPRVAWLGYPVSTRYSWLASISGVSTEAAAAAIACDRQDIALEWLEQGRSVVWQQLLNLRTPLDDLRQVDSHLANELVSTSQALERASMHDTNDDTSMQQEGTMFNKENQTGLSLEEAAQVHRRLAEKWDNLLQNVRMLQGFEDFMLPKKLSALTRAADCGPVVVINVHKSRSDALVLIPGLDDVLHIPLDSNFYTKVQRLQLSLNDELEAAGMGVRDARAGRLAPLKSGDHQLADILSSLWTDLVKPVLDGLAFMPSDGSDPPRIWWCPTGPLAFLPIHAAGIYNQSSPGPSLSDFAISSYTPTVTALLETSRGSSKEFRSLLGVSQSNTPGFTRLHNADKELELIKQFGPGLAIHSLKGETATVEQVLEAMEKASWVHFACHATQNSSSPLQSAFCLQNGPLTLSKIINKPFRNADFAFLSACETATGDQKLPEESVHLAAGMLAAGYRSVIATMWSIGDEDAPLVASEVYSRILGGADGPDSSMAAHALHHAVKRLREKLGAGGSRVFLSWVPFIHVGK